MARRRAALLAFPAAVLLFAAAASPPPGATGAPTTYVVDGRRGNDDNPGSEARPLRSLSAALARLPEPLAEEITIRILAGSYATTGGKGMPEQSLQLSLRMRPDARVRLVGVAGPDGGVPVLAWPGDRRMVDVRDGRWSLENLQIGSGQPDQRRGVQVRGPAEVELRDVRFELRSDSDAGIYAERGGYVGLAGRIALNAAPGEPAPEHSFCGIIATDGGIVEFLERDGASLELGNGSLAAGNYGRIRLGCASARITCWNRNSNNLSIGNSGRIDLRNTETTLRAAVAENTPIGLEDDGHILAEDAHILIEGSNRMAIALQKASTFTCNDLELKGTFETAVWAASGSMFVGRFLGDVGGLEADTGAGIHVEKIGGALRGPVQAHHGGLVSLPDRTVRGD